MVYRVNSKKLFFYFRLRDYPRTFDLDCGAKGFFPYLKCTAENLEKNDGLLDDFPEFSDFLPESQNPKTYKELSNWWQKEKAFHEENNIRYDLKNNLINYCCQDVLLTLRAVNKYRSMFKTLAGFDCFSTCNTLSAAGHLMFRNQFYSIEKPILIVSPHGVDRQTMGSRQAKLWLHFIEQSEEVHLQYEFKIGKYFADAYLFTEKPMINYNIDKGKHVLMEFQGCR